MTLVCSVMAWAADAHVSNITDLKAAIADASVETIYLDADIHYQTTANSSCINILRSVTIDGQGHTLSGYGKRGTTGNRPTIAINQGGSSMVDVVLKDLNVKNTLGSSYSNRPIETRGNIHSLTLDNVKAYTSTPTGSCQILTVGGSQASIATINIINSELNAGTGGYPVIAFNPIHLVAEKSNFTGYCGMYLKGEDGSKGTRSSHIEATDCEFNSPNVHGGAWNSFGMFALEDDGITIDLTNCGMDSRALGSAHCYLISLQTWAALGRRAQDITVNISGDNSYIICDKLVNAGWNRAYYNSALTIQATDVNKEYTRLVYEDGHVWQRDDAGYFSIDLGEEPSKAFSNNTANLIINVTGGTYAFNPELVTYNMHLEGEPSSITIPDEYEVKEIETQQGGLQTTLYRVRKKITTSNSINDNVEGQGAGQNEHTEFLISGDETVAANSTVANYVEVSNNATLTLPEGKKLEVTNGLDVTDGATLDVAAGSTLVVGEGGVTSENTGSIVIESNENGSASFLLSPEVIVNTTPNLTVKMTVKGKGYKNESAGKTYYWHRFAAPVVMAEEWSKAPSYGTWLYGWDYTAEGGKGAWAELPTSMAMVPFQGYTLSPEHLVASEDEEIVYSFKGQLAGNQNMNLHFNARGFNFFGNSYTGYIDVLTLVDQLMANANIDGSVYMWNNGEQGYEPVSLQDLKENPGHYLAWQKEIAPMQTFILRQINTGEDVSTLLNYENSIWKNPRYGNVPAPTPAPKRAAADADPFVRVMITAANGQNSQMSFAENADRSDDFEKGYDALKYMNENSINVYSTLDGQNLANVATNDLEGKTLTLQTNDEIAYTMSFLVAEGEEYAIRDNATGKVIAIEEGATYEFAAQPNSTVEGRFEIVRAPKITTAIENTEVKANVKGIYTIMGQYLGEDFDILPAGVYVVNGVKIVK